MPKLCMMRYGCTLSFTRGLSSKDMTDAQKHNKTANRGWTTAATRNLTNWLMKLDFTHVPGTPYAMTLTIPASHMDHVSSQQLHRMLGTWIRTAKRYRGLLHYYWLIEFTAQGTPHIHMTVWCTQTRQAYNRHTRRYDAVLLPPYITQLVMVDDWLTICDHEHIPARAEAQDVRPVDNTPEAWLAYTAKHSTRGVAHYQRRLDNMPPDWREHPGAMWGHDRNIGDYQADWLETGMDMHAFWKTRRLIRQQLERQARRIPDPVRRGKAIAATRRMLKHPLTREERQRKQWMEDNDMTFYPKSAFAGIRAWMTPEDQLAILDRLIDEPHTGQPRSGQRQREIRRLCAISSTVVYSV